MASAPALLPPNVLCQFFRISKKNSLSFKANTKKYILDKVPIRLPNIMSTEFGKFVRLLLGKIWGLLTFALNHYILNV